MTFRVGTFNVNSLRSRLPVLERWLPTAGVDVLCVQETKVTDDQFPVAEVEAMGYHAVFAGQKSYNGVAVLSRRAPDESVSGFNDSQEPNADSRLLAVRFGDLWIFNSYVPQGKAIDHPDYQYKKEFLSRLSGLVAARLPGNVLWVGDLNVAPTPLDVTNPTNKKDHVCFIQELRDLYALKTSALVDLLRRFHDGEELYSFFDYRVKNALERNIGWRIDHMLASPALAGLCRNCWIDKEPRGWEKPSDHSPMLADFDLEL